MKILISYIFCTRGGVETALYNRLKDINRNGPRIDLHFFNDWGGLPLFDDYDGNVFVQSDESKIQKIIKDEGYDAVISIDTPEMLKILNNMEYKGKTGLEVHTTYKDGIGYLKDKIMDIVDFIIVPSRYQKDMVQKTINGKNIYILENAVNEKMTYTRINKAKSGERIVLWVGRLDEHKNWRLFLKIAKMLHEKDSDILFQVVGGFKSRQSEIDEFENMIYEFGLECSLRWVPQAPYQSMAEIYSRTADSGGCYISTSVNESFGMTVVEAMACRCPVIVNDAGAMPELVADGRGLCLSLMNSPEQIGKIYEFIISPNHTDMTYRAEKYICKNLSSKRIGNKFIDILKYEINTTQKV